MDCIILCRSADERKVRSERKDLYIIVRNDVIGLISDCVEYRDYSTFNRYWNDILRQIYIIPGSETRVCLPENYFDIYEHLHMVTLADKKKKYKPKFWSRIAFTIFDVEFTNMFLDAQQNRNKCIMNEKTNGVQPSACTLLRG